MTNMIYAFSLYCEGNGVTKSYAFVSIREDETDARTVAMEYLLRDYPPRNGWTNHQLSCIEIPIEKIIQVAKEHAV